MSGSGAQQGWAGVALEILRDASNFFCELWERRKPLHLYLSREPVAPSSKSTALTLVSKSLYNPSFESCMLPHRGMGENVILAIMVYSDVSMMTKLMMFLCPKRKLKQISYKLGVVESDMTYHSQPPTTIKIVSQFGNSLFRVFDNPEWLKLLRESEKLYIIDIERKRHYVDKKSLHEVKKQLAEESTGTSKLSSINHCS